MRNVERQLAGYPFGKPIGLKGAAPLLVYKLDRFDHLDTSKEKKLQVKAKAFKNPEAKQALRLATYHCSVIKRIHAMGFRTAQGRYGWLPGFLE